MAARPNWSRGKEEQVKDLMQEMQGVISKFSFLQEENKMMGQWFESRGGQESL